MPVILYKLTTRDSPEPSPDVSESEPANGFNLVSLPALVRMKLTAWRDKDRMHLRDLASVGLLAQLPAHPAFSRKLQERLQHILDTPEDYQCVGRPAGHHGRVVRFQYITTFLVERPEAMISTRPSASRSASFRSSQAMDLPPATHACCHGWPSFSCQ